MSFTQRDIEELARRNSTSRDRVVEIVQDALLNGRILAPNLVDAAIGGSQSYAGGTNRIQNSDFSFSTEAWTVPSTPSNSTNPDNDSLYAVSYQLSGANIGTPVLATGALANTPKWDKTRGTVDIGDTLIANNHDIAIQFADNPVSPQALWYLRATLATVDTTPLPDGTIFYMGLWVKRIDATEGWISGEGVGLTASRKGVAGTSALEYLLVGELDTGYKVKSNLIAITDAPSVLNDLNYYELSFTGTVGFTSIELFRKFNGQYHSIARITNSAQLFHHDKGNNRFEVSGFPTVTELELSAYSEVFPFAVSIDTLKTFSDFRIRVPNFDTTKVSKTYVRMGIKAPTALNRQLKLDTVWAATTFNIWSPSPLDNPLNNPPSSLLTSGTPSTGTTIEPPGTSGTCVIETTDLLLHGDRYLKFRDIPDYGTVRVESGQEKVVNTIEKVIKSEVSELWAVEFTCGLIILCTDSHRFIRSFEDGTGVPARLLTEGQVLQGRDTKKGINIPLFVASISTVYEATARVTALKIKRTATSTPYYAGGNSDLGVVAFFHNAKTLDTVYA